MSLHNKDFFGNKIEKDDTVIFVGIEQGSGARNKLKIGKVTNLSLGINYCIQVKSDNIYHSVLNEDIIVSNNDPRVSFKILKEGF